VLFVSLLYYDAARQMANLSLLTGCGNATAYTLEADRVSASIGVLYSEAEADHLYLAGEVDNRVPDVWGSAYAVLLGLPSPAQAGAIINVLVRNASALYQAGQVRHLPFPANWTRFLQPVAPGTYQNGAYWATPLAWLVPVLLQSGNAAAARALVNATLTSFQIGARGAPTGTIHGIMEAINNEIGYHGVVDYSASATNVLFAEGLAT
jgi:hypothetical protein